MQLLWLWWNKWLCKFCHYQSLGCVSRTWGFSSHTLAKTSDSQLCQCCDHTWIRGYGITGKPVLYILCREWGEQNAAQIRWPKNFVLPINPPYLPSGHAYTPTGLQPAALGALSSKLCGKAPHHLWPQWVPKARRGCDYRWCCYCSYSWPSWKDSRSRSHCGCDQIHLLFSAERRLSGSCPALATACP